MPGFLLSCSVVIANTKIMRRFFSLTASYLSHQEVSVVCGLISTEAKLFV